MITRNIAAPNHAPRINPIKKPIKSPQPVAFPANSLGTSMPMPNASRTCIKTEAANNLNIRILHTVHCLSNYTL